MIYNRDFAIHTICKNDLCIKPLNKWWDGYNYDSNVLISDADYFNKDFSGYYLKIWADRYPFISEVK